jgi:lipopolysaccharide export system protein LptC
LGRLRKSDDCNKVERRARSLPCGPAGVMSWKPTAVTLATNFDPLTPAPQRGPGLADGHRAEAARLRAARSAAAYAQARRHSRLVRLLRTGIPIGALASFVVFIVFPFINPFRDAGVSVGAIRMDGTRVTMETPRLAGHRKDNKPYEVTADSAIQDIRVPNVIELAGIKARLVNADNSVLNLTANKAVFDTQKEQLQLKGDVRLRIGEGQEAQLKSADVDFKAGTVRSSEAVTVRLPDMSVAADSLDVVNNGASVAFIGRVSAHIDDRDSKAAAARRPAAPAGTPARPTGQEPSAFAPATSRTQADGTGGALAPDALPRALTTGAEGATPLSPARATRNVTVVDPATGRALPRSVP